MRAYQISTNRMARHRGCSGGTRGGGGAEAGERAVASRARSSQCPHRMHVFQHARFECIFARTHFSARVCIRARARVCVGQRVRGLAHVPHARMRS